ncbi:MAG: MaoC/PaaZ C-terminal domain-containing protein [Phenylobacterium sp.]|uniref:MaoC/PaaZ C-terminal domain-containing protein n=1 Tax=Phenylobacterium sp. TaxID=1871053 RepID=UPI0027364FE8|nr:MaoC/PaaZ C-terminal domain-containing protein [Phenylobacterium sp.]MDP3173597.1 MaoC/PaaZ C-terminal domain-containing protein [Phenylobacterium sp.]
MPIFYPDILQQGTAARPFEYGDKEVMLYAVGIGMGANPLDERELSFVYENGLKVVPTAVTVLADSVMRGVSAAVPDGLRFSTWDMFKMLHGEQKVEIHKPLPAQGAFTFSDQIIGAFDKGPDKGAIILSESKWFDAAGDVAVTLTTTRFARGDGGFGGPADGAPKPHPTPTRAPDMSLDIVTRPDQAVIYRLNGDRNPLHVDQAFARKGGFDQPILHGLCTYGITCRAVMQGMLDYDSESIASHQVRFSSPVYPGETVTVDMWRDGKEIAFEARIKARDLYVIRNGLTRLR